MSRWFWNIADIESLKGETLVDAQVLGADEEILFTTDKGKKYLMYHNQSCCESVNVESIDGELSDLIGSPILMAEEVVNEGESEWGTSTWTFYKLATVKGYVTIRWFGESNGYYSERVDFAEVPEGEGF